MRWNSSIRLPDLWFVEDSIMFFSTQIYDFDSWSDIFRRNMEINKFCEFSNHSITMLCSKWQSLSTCVLTKKVCKLVLCKNSNTFEYTWVRILAYLSIWYLYNIMTFRKYYKFRVHVHIRQITSTEKLNRSKISCIYLLCHHRWS